jgi:hypothetical protein
MARPPRLPGRVGPALGGLDVGVRVVAVPVAGSRRGRGLSPVEFVNEIRLEEASFLLRSTPLSAVDIAARVGFSNVATLRTLARRRRGVTLREIRAGGR